MPVVGTLAVAIVLLCGCASNPADPGSQHVVGVPSDYLTIQAALDAVADGDTVLIAGGTYTGQGNRALDFGGKSITVMADGRDGTPVIDCEREGLGFYFHSGEDSSTVIIGLTVINGSAPMYGGAVWCEGASPLFVDCAFRHCIAGHGQGGAIGCEDASPTFVRCSIDSNGVARVGHGGGGAYLLNSAARFFDCTFSGNACPDTEGGAMQCEGSSPVLESCVFTGNLAWNGGAISSHNSAMDITRCVFVSNHCEFRGGAIWCDGPASPNIAECTFYGNEATLGTSLCCEYSSPSVLNSVMSFGTPGNVVACRSTGTPFIEHCVVFANAGGDSLCGSHHENLFVDPLFCDAGEIGAGVAADSPCLADNNDWDEQIGAYGQGCARCN